MVIKGCSRGGAASLAAHLLRTDTNERAEVRELRGVSAKDLKGALREIEAVACGARSKRPFYHASINTRADEAMTPDQWIKAINRLEKELGLTGQPRAVVAHLKEGRAHVHIAWSRIDLDTLKAISDSHNYRRHELVARELEREFGHARVQGAHIEREGQGRPERTPSHAEMQQAGRSGVSPQQAKILLTELWNRTDSGQAFAAAVQEQGWILARGDRRDFVLLDPAGEAHSLGRRIEAARTTDVRARMHDVDALNLPSVAEAKARHQARTQERLAAPEHRMEATNGTAQSAARIQWRTSKSAAVGVQPSKAPPPSRGYSDEENAKPNTRAWTAKGGMVAQQQEAQRRFERTWEDIRAGRLGGASGGMDDQAAQRQRTDQEVPDRATKDDGRKR